MRAEPRKLDLSARRKRKHEGGHSECTRPHGQRVGQTAIQADRENPQGGQTNQE
jgi:hypothetical protein